MENAGHARQAKAFKKEIGEGVGGERPAMVPAFFSETVVEMIGTPGFTQDCTRALRMVLDDTTLSVFLESSLKHNAAKIKWSEEERKEIMTIMFSWLVVGFRAGLLHRGL